MCDSLQCKLSEQKNFVLLPCTIINLCLWRCIPVCLASLLIPSSGIRGDSVWETWSLSQRLDKSSSPDSSHSEAHGSLLLMLQITSSVFLLLPDLRGVIMAATLRWPDGSELLMSLSPALSPPIPHCLYAVFVLVLFPETGRRSCPNRHKAGFSNEWSCINCKKNVRVSSTAIQVFYKASFCSYGVLKCTAALAWFVACLVNFLLPLLKVFGLLLHWWCY